MDLDEARQVMKSEDASDLPRVLNAIAVVLRHHGIADRALVYIAEDIEAVADDFEQNGTR